MASKYTLSPTKKLPAAGGGRTTTDVLFDVGRALAQGLTFGTADEAEAFVRSKFMEGGKSYEEELENIRGDIKAYSEAHPYTSFALELIGSLPTAIAGGAGLARLGVKSGAKIAGLEGAAYGAGAAEGDAGDRVTGALTSGAFGLAGGKLAEKITPTVSAAAKSMIDKGYSLTPGQAYGGAIKSIEEGVSLPFVQDIIKGQQLKTRQQFNRKTVEDAVAGLGGKLPKGAAGEELVEAGSEIVSDAYERIIPQLSVNVTPLISKAQSIQKSMNPSDAKEFEKIIIDLVSKSVTNGNLSKQVLKDVETDLTAEVFATASKGGKKGRIGRAVKELRDELRKEITAQNPNVPELQAVNKAFSKMQAIEGAKKASVGQGGQFTPTQLLRQKGMQIMPPTAPEKIAAREARDVIGATLGSSGTAERLMRSSPLKTALGAVLATPTALMYGGSGKLGRGALQVPGRLLQATTPIMSTRAPSQIGGLLSQAQASSLEDMAAGGNIVGYESGVDRQGNPFTFAKMSDGRAVRVR